MRVNMVGRDHSVLCSVSQSISPVVFVLTTKKIKQKNVSETNVSRSST